MSAAIYILDTGFNLLICRQYRTELDNDYVIQIFKHLVAQTQPATPPILSWNSWSFVYVKCDDIIIMSPTNGDTNAMCLVTFLNRFSTLFRNYLLKFHLIDKIPGRITSESVKDNYILIYELFDEVADWGVPQLTEFNILKEYVKPPHAEEVESEGSKNTKSDDTKKQEKQLQADINASITRSSMAEISWRPKGIFYDKNEFFMDFDERLKFKYNYRIHGVMQNSIQGTINCKCYLSGMPRLSLQLNEAFKDLSDIDKSNQNKLSIFTNLNYHQCVQLQEEKQGVLNFIPPDGEFKLLSYQILHTETLKPLLEIKPEYVTYYKDGQYHLRIEAKLLTTIKRKYAFTNLRVTFPLTSSVEGLKINYNEPLKFHTKLGDVVHDMCHGTIVWNISKLYGLSKGRMVADFLLTTPNRLNHDRSSNLMYGRQSKNDLIYFDLHSEMNMIGNQATDHEQKLKLITATFELTTMLYSGLKVNYLQVEEPQLHFECFPWVKYRTYCQKDDYSFILSDQQFINKLTQEDMIRLQSLDTGSTSSSDEEKSFDSSISIDKKKLEARNGLKPNQIDDNRLGSMDFEEYIEEERENTK